MAEEEKEEEDDIIDGFAEYSPKSEFSKPKITFDASERCMQLRAKEMKKGYFNTTISKEGFPIKVWIEDSRKSFCSSVDALYSLLVPEILEDKKEKKESGKEHPIDKIKKRIKELFEKYAYYVQEPKYNKGKLIFPS